MASISLAAVRAKLLAKGLTSRPVCPRCSKEVEPKDFGEHGECRSCEAVVAYADARIMEIDRRLAELWGAGREGLGTPGDADEMDALERERWDMLAITDPAQLQQFSGDVFPPQDWGKP